MKLIDLFSDIEIISSNVDLESDTDELICDTRKTKGNVIFFSFSKLFEDNLKYSAESIRNGALCAVTELDLPETIPHIKIKDIRKNFSLLCKKINGNVCDKMKIIAITGTNGKTTTSYFLKSIIEANGRKCGIIGTNGAIWNNKIYNTGMTTPDSDELHRIFKKMYEDNIEFIVIEASAHAIYLDKLYGIRFEGVIFTNISQDHLDYFGNMKNYINAKLKILDNKINHLVVNNTIKSLFKRNINIYGLDSKNQDSAEYLPETGCLKLNSEEIKLKINGRHNAENALAAVKMSELLNIDKSVIKLGLENINQVPGRYNEFAYNGIKIICDYAHTPDALEKVLISVRESVPGKIITVFGCGGDRDKIKRPIMGRVVSKNSDVSVITSDNPRSENPFSIINDIKNGIEGRYIEEENRKKAIFLAVHMAEAGDCVLIAGKGCEDYQEINSIKYPYSDYKCIEEIMANKE